MINTNKERDTLWEQLLQERDVAQIEKAFGSLKPETQMVLILHYGEGRKFKDIGILMRISVSVVRNHHSNGIYKLYRYFNPRFPGELDACVTL